MAHSSYLHYTVVTSTTHAPSVRVSAPTHNTTHTHRDATNNRPRDRRKMAHSSGHTYLPLFRPNPSINACSSFLGRLSIVLIIAGSGLTALIYAVADFVKCKYCDNLDMLSIKDNIIMHPISLLCSSMLSYSLTLRQRHHLQ